MSHPVPCRSCRLCRSINKLLSLPPGTRLFVCCDHQPAGRELQFVRTVRRRIERGAQVVARMTSNIVQVERRRCAADCGSGRRQDCQRNLAEGAGFEPAEGC